MCLYDMYLLTSDMHMFSALIVNGERDLDKFDSASSVSENQLK